MTVASIDRIRAELKQKTLKPDEKKSLWKELSVQVFTQMLLNVYSSEIYKIVFMISTHLVARKEQDFEDCTKLIESIQVLTNSIKKDVLIKDYIQDNIRLTIEKYHINSIQLDKMITKEELRIILEKVKIKLNCVIRIPMPVFHITTKVFPEDLKGKNDIDEFLRIYCL